MPLPDSLPTTSAMEAKLAIIIPHYDNSPFYANVAHKSKKKGGSAILKEISGRFKEREKTSPLRSSPLQPQGGHPSYARYSLNAKKFNLK